MGLDLLRVALLSAQLADTVTGLMLPPGAEANPVVVALGPVASTVLKMSLALWVAYAAPGLGRWCDTVLVAGVVVGCIGLGSNLAVLL